MRHQEANWKFVLLGGDETLHEVYASYAALRGNQIQHFKSMHELGYLGRFKEYDAAIVHQSFQPLSGLELAEYLEKLFRSLPMILLTRELTQMREQTLLPGSIIECLAIDHHPAEVLEYAEAAATMRSKPNLAAVRQL